MYFQQIRDLREDADLSRREIAACLGIQQTVYSRYEHGLQTIPPGHRIRLADCHSVSTDYLPGRTQRPEIPH